MDINTERHCFTHAQACSEWALNSSPVLGVCLAPELKSSRQSLQVLVQRETTLLTPLREAWWRSGEAQLCLLAAVPFFQLSNEADKVALLHRADVETP